MGDGSGNTGYSLIGCSSSNDGLNWFRSSGLGSYKFVERVTVNLSDSVLQWSSPSQLTDRLSLRLTILEICTLEMEVLVLFRLFLLLLGLLGLLGKHFCGFLLLFSFLDG